MEKYIPTKIYETEKLQYLPKENWKKYFSILAGLDLEALGLEI